MFRNKKGVSEVIVTVLILLLIIAAVAILWIVISGFVRSSTERISLGVYAINLEIVENSLKYKTSGDLELRVKRSPGEGNLSSVKVLIEDEAGQQASYTYDLPIFELETKNIIVPASSISSLGAISRVSIAPIIQAGSGKKYPGDVVDSKAPAKGFVSSEELVLYMPFDEDVKDKSGNNIQMTNNGVTFSSGNVGQSGKFDSASQTWIENPPPIDNKLLNINELTVSAWVFNEKTSPETTGWGLVATTYDLADGLSNQRGWSLGDDNAATDHFYFKVLDSTGVSSTATMLDFFIPNSNKWAYVAGTFKGGQFVKLYINGINVIETNTGVISSISYNNAKPLRIGRRADNDAQGKWKGKIDEVRIYNRSLTDKEVAYLYRYG